jgi:GntR family transcriptional regulator/MocR family aminotransferase
MELATFMQYHQATSRCREAAMLRLDGEGALHYQVYKALRADILAGAPPTGGRMPSTRTLAVETGISRMTIQLAYEQLLAEGYVVGRHGSGTYVAEHAGGPAHAAAIPSGREAAVAGRGRAAPARLSRLGRRVLEDVTPLLSSRGHGLPRPRYDFRHGLPGVADFPCARWRRHLARQARRIDVASLDYPPAQGSTRLREAIAAYLRRSRGLRCTREQLVVVNGSQQGLDLAARVLLDPGTIALVEEPGYEGARSAFQLVGARTLPVPVDAEGIDLARAPAAARRARLAYVTPSHQYPLGGVLPLARRLALLEWAARCGAYVVEDDYDGEFRFVGRPVAPLKVLDESERVLFVGTFSKVMFPALRLGYVVVPPTLARAFARVKALTDGGTPLLEQEALAAFIESGGFERHLRRARGRHAERRAALLDAIARELDDRVEVVGTNAGLHVFARLPGWSPARTAALARRALAAGVGVYPATPYYMEAPREAGLVLGYGGLELADIHAGIRALAAVIRAER